MQFILTFLITTYVFAHGDNNHLKQKTEKRAETVTKSSVNAYHKINLSYIKNIKPTFQKSCFDCHSNQTNFPWYHAIPGIKQIIDQDIAEAKKHLDFSNDYPFTSHESPINDLISIQESVAENEMPPIQYRIMHSSTTITDKEKNQIIKWVNDSLKILNENAKDKKIN